VLNPNEREKRPSTPSLPDKKIKTPMPSTIQSIDPEEDD